MRNFKLNSQLYVNFTIFILMRQGDRANKK